LIETPAEIDYGVRGARGGRTRMCAVTRKVLPESELIRFVAGPDGDVVADLKARLPGRGVWVLLDRRSVADAVKRNAFARGLKTPVRTAPDLADVVAERLRQSALGRLGLARRAGEAFAGFSKVEAAVARDDIAALLVALDAAEDGLRKMTQALRRRFGNAGAPPLFRLFAAAEMGLAMGRGDVIHAAVLPGPAGRSFVDAANRLRRYESAGRAADEVLDAARPQETVHD
jgi:uncharacterized protein